MKNMRVSYIFTELTEGSLLGRKGFGELKKKNLSSGFSRDFHVIMSESQIALL